MHFVDFIVLFVYATTVIAIGVVAHRKQKSSEDYFLGGRKLPWWAIGVSILATSFSSSSLVGGVGFGFAKGIHYTSIQLGDLLGFGLVCVFFMGFFKSAPYTTAYEFIEKRFGVVARSLASLLFILQTLARAGLLVYAPAVVLAIVLDWSIETAIVVTAVAAILYSTFGGIGAVVWTDLIQVCVILAALVACLLLVASDLPGGFSQGVELAVQADKLDLLPERTWKQAFSLPWILLAYGVLSLQVAGTNQQAVQRYLACEDLHTARKAAMTGWGIGALTLGLSVFLGVMIGAWSSQFPDILPKTQGGDEVMAGFILQRLPPGLSGLLVAAIFAAAMSSLDSAIHSVSTAVSVDFLRRFGRKRSPASELSLARVFTLLFGLAALGIALLAAAQSNNKGLLETMINWLGYFAGPFVGLFVLAMLPWRCPEWGAVSAVLLAFAASGLVVASAWWKAAEIHALWLAPASLLLTLVLGLLSLGLARARSATRQNPAGPAFRAS